MPKDVTKNVDRYKIRGGELNEFDFHQNQEAYAEQQQQGQAANLIPGTPPEARKATKTSKATKGTKSTKKKKPTGASAKKLATRKAATKNAATKKAATKKKTATKKKAAKKK